MQGHPSDEPRGEADTVETQLYRLRYQESFDFALTPLLITDNQGIILEANHAATALLSSRKDFLVGMPLGLFVDTETRSLFYQRLLRLMRTYDAEEFTIRIGRRDKQPRDVSMKVTIIDGEPGKAPVLRWLLQDITEQRQASAARAELLHRLVTAQEDERRRVARELHDSVGQLLSALGLAVKSVRGGEPLTEPTLNRLDVVQRIADELGRTMHDLAVRLRPTALDDFGLKVALGSLINEWSERTGVDAHFQAVGLESARFTPEVETALYRVIQEALTNVTRHAQARLVSVVVERRLGGAIVVIEDDGVGFDPDTSIVSGRLGLLGMRERITLVGGSLEIESAPSLALWSPSMCRSSFFQERAIMPKLRILLADDHAIFREGLKSLVDTQPDMCVVEEAADGQTAWKQAIELLPDVVIMDLSMPVLSGAEATRLIRRDCPATKVLALTVHEAGGYLRQVLEAGASGYLLKRVAFEELVRAVRTVAVGGTYLDPNMSGQVVGNLIGADPQNATAERDLTGREAEVAQLLSLGHINREIADQLDVSIKTVETYKARIMEKLNLRSRADLVQYAIRRGWLHES